MAFFFSSLFVVVDNSIVTTMGRGDSNSGSPYKGEQAMPLTFISFKLLFLG
jgi:hypothetical protein